MFADINSNALVECWPNIRDIPRSKFQVDVSEDVGHSVGDADVLDFLNLLKFVPSRRVKMENAIKSLIVFVEVIN